MKNPKIVEARIACMRDAFLKDKEVWRYIFWSIPPLLRNMTVDDLITEHNDADFLTIGYTDNIALFIFGAFEEILGSLMRREFRIFENYCV